jgi:branched-chain amino acid transport system permease protein
MTVSAVESAAARSTRGVREMLVRGAATVVLAAAAVWLVINLVHAPRQFFVVLLDGLNNGALYALIALGYTLVYGIIELINFAHGDLFMLGAVVSAIMLYRWFDLTGPGLTATLLLVLVLLLTMSFCAGLNMLAELVAYRRLRRAPKLAPLITAVGISFIFQWIGQRPWMTGSTPKQWPTVITGGGFSVFGVQVQWATLVVIGVTVPLLLILTYIVQRTRQGKAMRATAQDQDAARLMGINVNRTIAFTFALGGAMAGAAGVLYVQSVGSTKFDLGFQLGLIAFTAAVLGGIGNLTGAVLGGFVIGIVQNFNEGLPYGLGQRWSQTVIFSILILLMVFRPSGLLGKPTTEKV